MKHIQKKTAPDDFLQWVIRKQQRGFQKDDWKRFRGRIKQSVYRSLLDEQGYLCCYCERRIESSDDCHIEHFHPKSMFPKKEFDYTNFLCSCQKDTRPGEPLHCGKAKGDWFDANLLISPLDSDCEERFAYTGDGGIRPRKPNDKAAKTTIDKLKLDINKLKAVRAKVIEPFLDEALSKKERIRFARQSLIKSGEKYQEFYTTIQYFLENGYL